MVLVLAAAAACDVAAAKDARVSSDYGYGAQAAPPPGEPIDLLGALKPVRKVAPEALATRPASARPARRTEIVAATPAAPTPAAPPRPASDATLTSAPLPQSGARPDWLAPERVGAPYEAKGTWYVPTPDPGYSETGLAVPFAARADGAATASGEPYSAEAILAAHPTLPIPSLVQITNLDTGREIIVRLVDRGPFDGRGLVALSDAARAALGGKGAEPVRVHVRYLGPAPRRVGADGRDAPRVAAAPVPAIQTPPVQAPAARADALTPPAADAFVVQVGAFGAVEAAEKARRAVAAAGPVAIDARGGLHRVRLGPVASRADAERLRTRVAALGFPSAIVAALR